MFHVEQIEGGQKASRAARSRGVAPSRAGLSAIRDFTSEAALFRPDPGVALTRHFRLNKALAPEDCSMRDTLLWRTKFHLARAHIPVSRLACPGPSGPSCSNLPAETVSGTSRVSRTFDLIPRMSGGGEARLFTLG